MVGVKQKYLKIQTCILSYRISVCHMWHGYLHELALTEC